MWSVVVKRDTPSTKSKAEIPPLKSELCRKWLTVKDHVMVVIKT